MFKASENVKAKIYVYSIHYTEFRHQQLLDTEEFSYQNTNLMELYIIILHLLQGL